MVDQMSGSKKMTTDDEPTFKDKLQNFANKYKLDKHHTIERFGVVSAAMLVTGTLVIGGGLVAAHNATSSDLTTVASYTSSFSASRTQVEGDVENVYRSSDGKRAMVMMRFKEEGTMSSDASSYQVYVTGIKDGDPNGSPTKVNTTMAGSIYSFGDTGYLGVLLESDEPFEPQLLNLTVRANEELVTSKIDSTTPIAGDESFSKYDQWRVIVNPGADSIVVADSLSSQNPDVSTMFAEMAVRDDEIKLRRKLNDDLANMRTALERINTYEAQLPTTTGRRNGEEITLVAPDLPPYLRGDSVEGMSSSQLRTELSTTPVDEISALSSMSQSARKLDFGKNDTAVMADARSSTKDEAEFVPNTYQLNSQQVVPGGYNFDWRNKSIMDGYLDDVVPAGEDPSMYIASRVNEATRGSASTLNLKWVTSDGMEFGTTFREADALMPLSNLRNNLAQAYADYYRAKSTYQSVNLRDLLLLDVDTRRIGESATIGTGQKHVTFNM